MTAPPSRAVVLAGSCSAASLGQIAPAQAAGFPVLAIDVEQLAAGRQSAMQIAEWAAGQTCPLPPVIYSGSDAAGLAHIHSRIGREASGALVEQALADVAVLLQAAGFSRFAIAGGETSGAIAAALGPRVREIGPEIDPRVPWTRNIQGPDMVLALKSGNFGAPDFIIKAWSFLEPDTAT